MENFLEKYRENFIKEWYQQNGTAFFILLSLLYFGTLLLKRMFILDGIAAFEILQERGEIWVMELFFGLQYVGVPIFLAWKFTVTSFVLWVGCFMFGYKVTYAQLWKLVMIMELVFILAEIIKVLWFTSFSSEPTYQEFISFYPLSLINLFDHQSLDPRWIYPLKALNIFECIYWGLLMAGVYWLSNKNLKIPVAIVCSSYILFFFIWLGYFLIAYK